MPNEELISLSEKLEQLIDDAQNSHWHAKFAAQEATANKPEFIRILAYIAKAEHNLTKACDVAKSAWNSTIF